MALPVPLTPPACRSDVVPAGLSWSARQAWLQARSELQVCLGEPAAQALLEAVRLVHDCTSSSAVELVCSTSPLVARRCSDVATFRTYLELIVLLAQQAPRGLRRMLPRLALLLQQLSLAGLERWALQGVAAHASDFAELERYFSLQSPVSRQRLQQEGRYTLFPAVQRRAELYLRMLWGQGFRLASAAPGEPGFVAADGVIYMPDCVADSPLYSGTDYYRAAAAHAAAHVLFSRQTFLRRNINPMQHSLISLLEDARVEQLASARFPGLRSLWLKFFPASPRRNTDFEALLQRLSRALLDPHYAGNEDNGWVQKACRLFHANPADWHDAALSLRLGLLLAHDLGQMRVRFNAAGAAVFPSYRDDNRSFWQPVEESASEAAAAGQPDQADRVVAGALPDADRQQGRDGGNDASISAWQAAPASIDVQSRHVYPEWDCHTGCMREGWVTLRERLPAGADGGQVEQALAEHAALLARLQAAAAAFQSNSVRWLRKQLEGEMLDLDAVIRATLDIRERREPDMRVEQRRVAQRQPLSVLLLLDLSESTRRPVAAGGATMLQLILDAAALFGTVLESMDDAFAIGGFASNGRHEVNYYSVKTLQQSFDHAAKSRLAGLQGGLSTRLGTALRHAGALLQQGAPAGRKLIIVLTDGEPADIDVADPAYLLEDAGQAVRQLRRGGIESVCLNLDPRAASQVMKIFGARRFRALSNMAALPQALTMLYLALRR